MPLAGDASREIHGAAIPFLEMAEYGERI